MHTHMIRCFQAFSVLFISVAIGCLSPSETMAAIEWEGDEKIEVLEAFVKGDFDGDVAERVSAMNAMTSTDFISAAASEISNSTFVPVYESEFSSDPGWITDDSGSFYWQASTSALFAKAESRPPTYQPNRYFVTETALDPTRSFVLEADLMILEFNGSSVVTFGLYADDLRSSNQVGAGRPRSNGTFNLELIKLNGNDKFWENNIVDKDRLNLGGGGFTTPAHVLNTWYHIVFTYDAETATASMLVTNKETGEVYRTRTRAGVNFSPDMRFLGVATNPQGLPGTSLSFANDTDGSASFLIDNVVLAQAVDGATPAITNLGQYKLDGVDSIEEGEIFVGNTTVFKADVVDPDGDDVQLEIELIPTNGEASRNYVSEVTSSDATISVTVEELIPKDNHYIEGGNEQSFRWRARAIDSLGGVSEWQEFGTPNNIDFSNKVVPLWTQGTSDFPSRTQQEDWADDDYANGDSNFSGSCGRTIAQCGCAISSMVMLGHYYGIETDIENSAITPDSINDWLENENGYQYPGLVKWGKAIEYMGRKDGDETKVYLTLDHYNTVDTAVVNDSLTSNAPVLAYSNRYGHYFLIDGQLSDTYSIRDPRWYNTLTLNDTQDYINEIQAYRNIFDKANVFSYHPETTVLAGEIYLYLASPAELLITDAGGNRLGVDPVTGSSYTEIPNGTYTQEGNILSSDDELENDDIHFTKVIRIPSAEAGNYSVEVIGTGEGDYQLSSLIYDSVGNSTSTIYTSDITIGQIDSFILSYTPNDLSQIDIEPEPKLEKTPTELFVQLRETLKNTVTKPRLLSLLWQTQVQLAASQYERGKILNAIILLRALDVVIDKMPRKTISEIDAKSIRAQIEQLIDILKG